MSTARFDLIDIVQTIRKRFKFILIVSIIAAVIGAIFYFTRKKEFKATAQFFVSNPLLSDRNSIYGGADSRMDYFANEDDVDRVTALAESDTVILQTLHETNLAHDMDKDLIDAKNIHEMKTYFKEHVNIKRTEYTMMEVSFIDKDAIRAARIANAYVDVIEKAYRRFYTSRRTNMLDVLTKKYAEQDSTINVLTDTLAKLRDRTGIYDLMSPNRNNIINGTVKTGGGATGKDIEAIQNIEAIKDNTVIDQARISSLLNQFSTGTGQEDLKLFSIISKARQPIVPKGPSGPMTVIIAGLLGLFFAVLYVLIATYYKTIISVER